MKKKAYAGFLIFILTAFLLAQGPLQKVKLWDTNNSHALELKWNENDVAARTLNFLVSGADRSYTITGNSTNNQDVSTTGSPTHPTLYLTTRLFVNETTNTNQTRGITVNQGATTDDQVLAFKADAVDHGITTKVETDTWGQAHIFAATNGGMSLDGFTEQSTGIGLGGWYTVGNTLSTSEAVGAVDIYAGKKSGTTIGNCLATENVFVIRPWIGAAWTTVLTVKASGNTWQAGNLDVDGTADIASTLAVGAAATFDSSIHAHQIWINDTSNIHQTSGLTVAQATDEIISLKSPGLAHGITGLTETDTYAYEDQADPGNGGHQIVGITKTVVGMSLAAVATTDNTTKGATALGEFRLTGYKKSGTTITDPGTDANILTIWKGATANVWQVDEDGDTWQSGTITAGSLAGVLKGTAGLISAVADTTAADYLGGDAAYHTLNQAAVAGLTTASSPQFTRLGLGGVSDTSVALRSWGEVTSGLAQYGLFFDNTISGTIQSNLMYTGGVIKTATAVTDFASLRIDNVALGSGATVVNDYGIYIAAPTRGSAINYAIWAGGNSYFVGDINCGSVTDHTPYPHDKTTAYDAVKSHQKKSSEDKLDHSRLTDFIKSGDDGRNLSATVSSLCEVVKDLIERIDALEKKK